MGTVWVHSAGRDVVLAVVEGTCRRMLLNDGFACVLQLEHDEQIHRMRQDHDKCATLRPAVAQSWDRPIAHHLASFLLLRIYVPLCGWAWVALQCAASWCNVGHSVRWCSSSSSPSTV